MSSNCFSAMEIDAIGEILNISLGASATAVSTMLNARVDITTPVVKVVSKSEFTMDKVEPAVGIEITYISGLEGRNIMLLKKHDVKIIVEMLMGMEIPEEEFELNEMYISAVCEVMNQMMGSSATALSEFLGRMVNISTPVSFEVDNSQEFIDKYFVDEKPRVMVGFNLKIGDKLESEFFNVMPIELAKGLVEGFLPSEEIMDFTSDVQEEIKEEVKEEIKEEPKKTEEAEKPESVSSSNRSLSQEEIEALLAGNSETAASAVATNTTDMVQDMAQPTVQPMAQPTVQPMAQPTAQPMAQPTAMPQNVSADMSVMQMQMMQQMMQQMQQMQQQLDERKTPSEPKVIQVQPPVRPNLNQDKDIVLEGEQEENMGLIMGVPLEISVEIGRTKKLVKDILEFTKGSLVVLDKLAGEQVDLFVNGQCIAKGDVVVVEDNFGIRITEIMNVNLSVLE